MLLGLLAEARYETLGVADQVVVLERVDEHQFGVVPRCGMGVRYT
jgi:hypothetical protein